MSAITDMAVSIKLDVNDFETRLRALESHWKSFSSAFDHAPQANKHFESMANSAQKAANSIQRSMNLAKVAVAGFLGGKALHGVADWFGSTGEPGEGKWADFLRNLGGDPKAVEKHMADIRSRMSHVGRVDYMRGTVDALGMLDSANPKHLQRAMESTINLEKALGPDSTREQASNILRAVMGSYGAGKSAEQKLALMERIEGLMPTMIKGSGIRGSELAQSLTYLVGVYQSMGKQPEELAADVVSLGNVMGTRTGELLKNVVTRFPEGIGKMATAIAKHQTLRRLGYRRETEMPEKTREWFHSSMQETQQHWQEWAAEKEKTDPREMYGVALRQLQRARALQGFDANKAIREAYSETAEQGLPIFLGAQVHGSNKALVEAAKKASFLEQRHQRHQDEQSYESAYTKLVQTADDLHSAIFKGFKSALGAIYEPYTQALKGIADAWRENSDQIANNIKASFTGIGAGFTDAIKGMPSMLDAVKELSRTLADPEARKSWEEWGKAFGQDLGGAFRDAKEAVESLKLSLQDVHSALKGIYEVAKTVTWPFRQVLKLPGLLMDSDTNHPDAYRRSVEAAVEQARKDGKISEEEYQAILKQRNEGMRQRLKEQGIEMEEEEEEEEATAGLSPVLPGEEGPVGTPEYHKSAPSEEDLIASPLYSSDTAGTLMGSSFRSALDQYVRFLNIGVEPADSSDQAGDSGRPEINLTCNVMVGDRELRDIIAEVIEDYTAHRAANHRMAAGNAGFSTPWLG